ncbi:MAG: AmmeMemoRadiSam system protein B, partial [Rhodoferax sp.]
MHRVRQPAVAGAFYPGQGQTLSIDVMGMLAAARSGADTTAKLPKAIIVPHAGYIYSGPTAALAY